MTATLSPALGSSAKTAVAPRRYRILIVASHPVQYASPVFREMARHPRLDVEVVYCSLQGARTAIDQEFGVEVKWDVPMLDGYPWVEIPNRSLRPGLGRFFGLLNPALWDKISRGRYDAVLLLTGYVYASFWIALLAAKRKHIPALFGTDATTIEPMTGWRWKRHVKRLLLPHIYSLADVAVVASAATRDYLESLDVPEARIAVLPLVVDNDWWLARSAAVDRKAVRSAWRIPIGDPVVLFCAKLQTWKRPFDLLRAFEKTHLKNAWLVYVGEGPLRKAVEDEAAARGLSEQVRFLGFVNQSRLPEVYSSADLFVLPSKYDACPAAVCEAMLCGTPAVISDEIRGRFDIVQHGETGYIFPCGDVGALASILPGALEDPARLERMRQAAREKMKMCSPAHNAGNLVAALDRLRIPSGSQRE